MTRQKTDEVRKQQIRAAATRCFVRRGFAATRLLDIAREAGLSKGGVYFHYRAKDTLFHDILDAQFAALEARWGADQTADQPADKALHALVAAHLQTLEASPDEARFCNLMLAMSSQDPVFREKLVPILAEMRRRYADLVRRGTAAGVFAASDADSVAVGIIALVYGLAAQSAGDEKAALPVSAEQGAELAVRLARGAG